jgi:hypothetical protein
MRKSDIIYESVSMADVLRDFAGVEPKRGRLSIDPLNGCEGHDCFSINRNVYHCFVCGDKGNVIQFVAKLLDTDFRGAMDAINARYRLWDDLDEGVHGLTEKEQKAIQEKVERRRHKQKKRELQQKKYDEARDELERLTANQVKYAPKNPGDPLDPRFVEACQKLAIQEYIVMSMGGGEEGGK